MFKEINEGLNIIEEDKIYILCCNCLDKDLKGSKNNTLINIICKNAIEDIYVKTKDIKKEMGYYTMYNNIFYLFNQLYGGKSKTKADSNEQRFEYFKIAFNKIVNIIISDLKLTEIILDYGNLIYDPNMEDMYDKYKEYFNTFENINITIYIDIKYKTLNIKNIEPSINIKGLEFLYHTIEIENIFLIKN
jgi:hypothetical protein